jgi:hypothetical protein
VTESPCYKMLAKKNLKEKKEKKRGSSFGLT